MSLQPDVQLPKQPYVRKYTALLTQTGTNAPTAIVLQNNLGLTITYSRTSGGVYRATFSSAPPATKVTAQLQARDGITLTGVEQHLNAGTVDYFEITTNFTDNSPNDGYLTNCLFEIRLYQD